MPTPSKAALILKKQVDAGMIAQLEKALKLPRHSKRASPLQAKIAETVNAQIEKALKLPRHSKGASPLQVEIAEKVAKKVNAQIEKALKPAEVTITVTEFKNIFAVNGSLKNRSTVAGMDMKMKDHPRVRVDHSKPGKHEFDKLVIGPKGATIRFTILPRNKYSPIGIAFNKIEGKPHSKQQDRIGFLNFQTSQMPRDRHTLLITDSFKDKEQDDHYKFSVIIQRMKDGAIGIIDPPLDHEHKPAVITPSN